MRAAALQFRPILGDVPGNLSTIERLVDGIDAELIVLPELCLSGYELPDQQEVARCAQAAMPSGDEVFARLTALAMRRRVVLVGGFAERADGRVYNAAFVLGPSGPVGVYRKVHLFGDELRLFEPGDLGFPVFDLGGWCLGVMICFDWMFPEAARSLALAGADVIAHPSNLVLPWCQEAVRTRALENGVYVITANRVGTDRALTFTGASQIVDPRGHLEGRAPAVGDAVVLAELDLALARDKWVTPTNHRLADRRPDQYRR
jgi:predicted amidohydrolase